MFLNETRSVSWMEEKCMLWAKQEKGIKEVRRPEECLWTLDTGTTSSRELTSNLQEAHTWGQLDWPSPSGLADRGRMLIPVGVK